MHSCVLIGALQLLFPVTLGECSGPGFCLIRKEHLGTQEACGVKGYWFPVFPHGIGEIRGLMVGVWLLHARLALVERLPSGA